jgi:hydrogenase maturation protease
MERLIGYERAIVVDALQTGAAPPGSLVCCRLEDLPGLGARHLASAHEASLQVALEVGRRLNAALPARIFVVGVEAPASFEFSETLSPPVAAAVPAAAAQVRRLLKDAQP